MVNSHVILMKLTVMMLELIANKMRLVAYTDVRVLDELSHIYTLTNWRRIDKNLLFSGIPMCLRAIVSQSYSF